VKNNEGYRTGKVSGRTTVAKPVKGGWVAREAETGRFTEVGSQSGTYRASQQSEAAIEQASKKRSDALRRLADR
jgi:hypothetical protein